MTTTKVVPGVLLATPESGNGGEGGRRSHRAPTARCDPRARRGIDRALGRRDTARGVPAPRTRHVGRTGPRWRCSGSMSAPSPPPTTGATSATRRKCCSIPRASPRRTFTGCPPTHRTSLLRRETTSVSFAHRSPQATTAFRRSTSWCSASVTTGTQRLSSRANRPSMSRIAAVVEVPAKGAREARLTLTAPVIEAARSIVVMAVGRGKNGPLERAWLVEGSTRDTPARIIRHARGAIAWVIDRAAGGI